MIEPNIQPDFSIGDVVLVTCGEYKGADGEVIARFSVQGGMIYQVSLHDYGVETFRPEWIKLLIRAKKKL
jgi:hypothetical protein